MAVDLPCRLYVSTAGPRCQWTAHFIYGIMPDYNYLADYKVQRLQYLQSLAAIQTNLKIIQQTVLLASGVQQCVEPFPHLAVQHACLSTWPMATCL